MGVGDMLADSGVSLPSFSMSGVGNAMTVFLLVIVGAGIVLGLTVWISRRMMFNKTIEIFKMVDGQNKRIDVDKGMLQRIGMAGDVWLISKKHKKTLAYPRIEVKKDTYWFFIREDGEWINFGLGNFDEQMKLNKAKYMDSDMALSRIAIERNLKDRYQKETFWQKYGQTLMNILFMIVMMVCVVVVMTKTASNIEILQQINKESLKHLSNIASSGVVPA